MITTQHYAFPQLHELPATLPKEGAISMTLDAGVPVFRASRTVQTHIDDLLYKQQTAQLTPEEVEELDRYEEIDDYLSHLNRVVRNLLQV